MNYLRWVLLLSVLFGSGCGINGRLGREATVISFPPLSGTYAVGRAHYDMMDDARAETYTADVHDVREFAVTVFYPAVPAEDSELADYVEESLVDIIAEDTEVADFVFEQLQPHAYVNVPVADGAFPVILFSHGLGVPIIGYTGQMENLASHGYIVVGIAHTYATPAVALSDGRVLAASDGILLELEEALDSDEEAMIFLNDLLSVWVDDMLFTLDQLANWNAGDSLLANHIDLLRVGAAGHSFGGATAFEAAYRDERILAAVDMDGSVYGDVLANGLSRPAMMMAQDVTLLADEGYPDEVIEAMSSYDNERAAVLGEATPGYDIVVADASHGTFATDVLVIAEAFPKFAVSELIGRVEDFDTVRSHIHDVVLTFFDMHVAGVDAAPINTYVFDGFDITAFNNE